MIWILLKYNLQQSTCSEILICKYQLKTLTSDRGWTHETPSAHMGLSGGKAELTGQSCISMRCVKHWSTQVCGRGVIHLTQRVSVVALQQSCPSSSCATSVTHITVFVHWLSQRHFYRRAINHLKG